MSSSNSTQVNSELPDEDALGAFAASALAGPRRSRKNRQPAADPGDGQQDRNPDSIPAVFKARQETAPQPKPEPEPAAAPPAVEVVSEEPGAAATGETEAEVPEKAPEEVEVAAPAAPIPSPATPAPAPVPVAVEQAELEVRAPAAVVSRATTVPMPDRSVVAQVDVPNLGAPGSRATQCTIMVSTSVRDRIAHYQLTKKMETGKEPTNSVVVRRAFLHAKRGDLFQTLLSAIRHRQNPVDDEDYDDDGLLGEVLGRRVERGRMKDSQQQSFRPSYQELATYDAFSVAYGFPSRSDFLDACLDEFLPSLPASGRRGR